MNKSAFNILTNKLRKAIFVICIIILTYRQSKHRRETFSSLLGRQRPKLRPLVVPKITNKKNILCFCNLIFKGFRLNSSGNLLLTLTDPVIVV